jgi:hypothetical protein
MRVRHSLQTLTILTTLAACGSPGATPDAAPVAAAPVAAPPVAEPAPAEPAPALAVGVQWDSGPLDRAYRAERVDMDARHSRERTSPRANESSTERDHRQSSENKVLELRYTRGKASHARTLPAAER